MKSIIKNRLEFSTYILLSIHEKLYKKRSRIPDKKLIVKIKTYPFFVFLLFYIDKHFNDDKKYELLSIYHNFLIDLNKEAMKHINVFEMKPKNLEKAITEFHKELKKFRR